MYTALGQSQPIWSWLSYGAFYGGLTLLIWWRVEQGATARSIWRLSGVLVAIGIATEIVCIQLGTYEYLRGSSVPRGLVPAVDRGGQLRNRGRWAASSAARLSPVLTGRQAWAMIALVPAVMPAMQIGTKLPGLGRDQHSESVAAALCTPRPSRRWR